MNRVEELIERLCPDGVEYKRLGEVGKIIRGNGLQKKDFTESGIGCIHYGQIYTHYKLFTYETKSFVSSELATKLQKVQKGDIVLAVTSENVEDVCKCVAWLGNNDIVTGGHSAILKHNQNPKYITYWLNSSSFDEQKRKLAQGTKVIDIQTKKLERVIIPLPPLEVQNEIVNILDRFTQLEAELEAELEARKKQYEYYKDTLLTFDNSVPWKSLEEEFSFIRNGFVGTVTPYFTSKETGVRYLQGTNIHNGIITDNEEYYITTDFHKKHIKNELKADDIIMVQSGHVGDSAVVGEKYKGSNCHALIIMSNSRKNCNSKFINYYFQSTDGRKKLNAISTGGTLKHILSSKMKKFKIPVPSLEEQARIVSILDRFDQLCNDLTKGLPAEIEARKKQYEYYREKLLTFKKKETELP